jgi:L-fucose isomerase-like protein
MAEEATAEEVGAVAQEMRECLDFGEEPSFGQLEKTARLTCALRKKVRERNFAGVTMKCVYGVSRHMGFTPCLTQALLARETTSICESDVPGLITQVILQALTGQPATFLENYEYYADAVLAGVCGFVPFAMARDKKVRCMCAGWGGFSGIYETPDMREGRVTIARLYSENGALKMLLMGAEGTLPKKWAELGWSEPMPKFPSLMLRPDCSVEAYAQGMVSQHINVVYGEHRERVKDFCRFTGIEVTEL